MKKIQITARTRAPEPITQSVLDRAVERGKARQSTDKVFGLADWLEDQYDPTYSQAQAAVELRRLVTENLLLRQRHLDDNVEYTRVLAQREALLEALERIAQLSMSQFHIPYDMAAEACNIASAALVESAEREACAKVCDDLLANPHTGGGWSDAMIEAAAAIRSRSNT